MASPAHATTQTIQTTPTGRSAKDGDRAHQGGGGAKDESRQYLTFMLAGDPFAIGILSVKEIIEFGDVTPVPMVPAFIRGVINLRGSVVPVIDLTARFGKEPSKITKRTAVVIIEIEGEGSKQDIGVMVDAVNTVLEIPQADIEPAPAFGAKIRTDFISGMGKVNGRFVIILNVNHVLSIEEMSRLLALGGGAEEGAQAH